MADLFKKRSTILGLPIGRKKVSWRKVGGWLAGLAVLVTGVVIGRDTIQHSGTGQRSSRESQETSSGGSGG